MSDKNFIMYDANFSKGEFRGMGKYINSFLQVLTKKLHSSPVGLLKKSGDKDDIGYFSFGHSNYIMWEQFSLLKYRNTHSGIMIFPYNTAPLFLKRNSLNILILHDLIFLNSSRTKSLKQKIGKLYRSLVVPLISKKFDRIITVSEFSKSEIVNKLKITAEKITVIPNCIDLPANYYSLNPGFDQRNNTIFHIGGEPEYKNTKSILFAFASLGDDFKSKFNLKIIGIRNSKTLNEYHLLTKELEISDRVEFLGYQKDEDIIKLYQTSKLFIFPSKQEGFGIPLIEAMKYGCPLACSNVSCLPEIAGNAASYFDPNHIESISKAITYSLLIDSNNNIQKKIDAGYEQVKKFSTQVFEDKIDDWLRSVKFEQR